MKRIITSVIAFSFMFGVALPAFAAATSTDEVHHNRTGDYMLCVKNDVFGDCDNDWDARAERHYWNQWKGGAPAVAVVSAPQVSVEDTQRTLLQKLLELLRLYSLLEQTS